MIATSSSVATGMPSSLRILAIMPWLVVAIWNVEASTTAEPIKSLFFVDSQLMQINIAAMIVSIQNVDLNFINEAFLEYYLL